MNAMIQSDSCRDTAAPVSLLTTVGSVLCAFFGVQSSRARHRDFSHGSPALFFMVAMALTAMFAILIVSAVRLLLHGAGLG
jgi:hypothetical protein